MQSITPNKSSGIPVAQVMRTLELIAYQEGSVISREVVKHPTGSVTIFAFDEGQGLSEHTSPFGALLHVLEGEAEISIDGNLHRLHGGEMILMPAHHPHALKAIAPLKLLLTMLR